MRRGSGGSGCLGRPVVCWEGGEHDIVLRDDSDSVRARTPLPREGPGTESWATAVHADPHDGSAWVLQGRRGRLLNVDTDGAIRYELTLVPPGETYALSLTADFANRAIWYTHLVPSRGKELVRIDLADPRLPREVHLLEEEGLAGLARLAPDLEGGVWIVTRDRAFRVTRDGRVALTVALDEAGTRASPQ